MDDFRETFKGSRTDKLVRICELVRSCGAFIRNADRSSLQVDDKGGRANFVTAYDKEVQERLRAGLAEILPEVTFVGEEGEGNGYRPRGSFWIVDPIDGTTNFIKDYRVSAVSVALVVDGAAELGVVYNPYLDEMFTAVRGEGACCNGKPVRVSEEPLERGVVLFGTAPYNPEFAENTFALARAYFEKSLDIRRSGSAALDLCYVAAGRAELFFEFRLSPWDHAAGGLVVREAGGLVSDLDGNEPRYDRPCTILARNATVRPLESAG